ncbi:DUF547 domain-containing protein [Porticoccus sp. W117]|uniref:DUF547 domain-containing protein n=1 Tax=Porticoccus sp. W117 TaxID=3054777 RepID=UPI00259AAAC8|nr:DUF547 domain-containing protein [Porticoccus sp. W117]MDM3869810.1 DUF547 domain-containing protein [Porticoccus sp. W117]
MKLSSIIAIFLATAVLAGCNSSSKPSGNFSQPFWATSNEQSAATIDHSRWNRLLNKYVVANHPSKINRFRYGDVSGADKKALGKYISQLTAIDPRQYRKPEQKAYWINLYNALVVQQILANYPIASIADMQSASQWDKKRIVVQGQKLSLNDIEHQILRPLWRDHRIHFALVDGSLGAPNLQPRAYTGRTVRAMLKQAGREFLNHPRGLKLEKGKMQASRVFADHSSDFAQNQAGLLKLFAYYVDDRKALYLLGFQGEIEYQQDLALNAP